MGQFKTRNAVAQCVCPHHRVKQKIVLVRLCINGYLVMVDHSFKHGCFPILIQYLTTALERILFSSVVIVLAFRPGVSGSNPVQILYF